MQYFSFEKLFSLFLEKQPHQTTFHVVKSITYFADAEKDPYPVVFDKNVTWRKVKNTFENEIRKL